MDKRREEMASAVLAILRAGDRSYSAFKLLKSLKDTYPKIAPRTVYRALTDLVELKQIHRLGSLNSFIVCQSQEHQQRSIILIHRDFGLIAENFEPDVFSSMSWALKKIEFWAQRYFNKVNNICANCGPRLSTS